MATCKIGEFKFSLHMNEFRSEVGFPTFYCLFVCCCCCFFFFANKDAPTKVKANRRKPRTLVYRVSVKINPQKKISCPIKKLNIPFLGLAKANGPQSLKQL